MSADQLPLEFQAFLTNQQGEELEMDSLQVQLLELYLREAQEIQQLWDQQMQLVRQGADLQAATQAVLKRAPTAMALIQQAMHTMSIMFLFSQSKVHSIDLQVGLDAKVEGSGVYYIMHTRARALDKQQQDLPKHQVLAQHFLDFLSPLVLWLSFTESEQNVGRVLVSRNGLVQAVPLDFEEDSA